MEPSDEQTADAVSRYTDSWKRIEAGAGGRLPFFALFYRRFMACSEEIAGKFAGTDPDRQQLMLKQSFSFMEFYYTRGEANAQLLHIARRHSRADLDIPPAMYVCWLESLLETVRESDSSCDEDVLDAWRTIFEPGIAFMKSMY